jgi:hypothetical protein
MNVWSLLLIFEMVLVSVVLIFVFVSWRRKQRMVSKAHSPEHRLKIPNVWTEIQHVKHGGSTQMMRMKDGNFILLSAGVDITKVLVSPQFDPVESCTEAASFPVNQFHGSRRQQQAAILNDLRKQIGFPQSVRELRDKLQGFLPPAA